MLTAQQIQARSEGIGASEAAVVLGFSPYMTPYELWRIKTGRDEAQPILNESRVRLRHAHEETVAQEYAFQKNCKVRRSNKTLYHKKYPHILCHLDRIIVGKQKLLECKSSTSYMKKFWGENGTDQVPDYYVAQVQHQYSVTDYEEGDLAVLIDIDDFRAYEIPRDNYSIKVLEEQIDHFWRYHVLEDNAPEPTNRNDLLLMYPTSNGNLIEPTDEIITEIDHLKMADSKITELEKIKKTHEKNIIYFIGENDGIVGDPKPLVTYKANVKGIRSFRFK